jgi:hypothetical protein
MNDRPVKLIVSDDLKRSQLTVFFRLILAIPHLIWLAIWGIAAFIVAIVNWFATLVQGQSPQGLHDFLAGYVRYAIHVYAYLSLAAEPFPDFLGKPLLAVAVLGWFASLATGSMPRGLRNAGALALRYSAQLNGYLGVITDAYPYSGPTATPAVPVPGATSVSAPEPAF